MKGNTKKWPGGANSTFINRLEVIPDASPRASRQVRTTTGMRFNKTATKMHSFGYLPKGWYN